MSRINTTSKSQSIPTERMDSFRYEDRSSLRCETILTPMALAMPCKTSKKCKHGETCGKTNDFKSKLACILEASESTRLRMEESLPNHHEDDIAGKGDNSLQHHKLLHKFIPMPQAMKIPQQKQQWIFIFGIWLLSVSFFTKPTQQHQRSSTGKLVEWYYIKPANSVDSVPSNAKFSRFGAMLYIFEDNEAVIKMIIKGRSPTMRDVSRTHRVAFDCLFDRINLEPQDSNQVCRHQTPTRRHIDKRKFHTRWVEQSSLSVEHQPFQLSLLCSEFQLDQLHQNDGEKDARTGRRPQDRCNAKADDDEPGCFCLDKFFDCEQLDARVRNHDAASSSQGSQKDAFLDVSTGKPDATEEDQEHLNYPEDSVSTGNLSPQDVQELQEIQEIQETRKPKAMTKIGHTISIIHQIMCCTWRRSSRSWDKDVVSARRIKWRPRCEHSNVFFFCLSLFKLLFILWKITRKIKDLPRINPWHLWDGYFMWLRGWSRIRQKWLDWPRLTGSSLWGESTLWTDRAVQVATVKTYVFSDPGGVNRTPHTSHFLVFHKTYFNVARDIGSTSCHHAFGCAFDLVLFDPQLCTLHRLSHLPFHSPVLHLQLPCGLVRWEVPCALPRMRS